MLAVSYLICDRKEIFCHRIYYVTFCYQLSGTNKQKIPKPLYLYHNNSLSNSNDGKINVSSYVNLKLNKCNKLPF